MGGVSSSQFPQEMAGKNREKKTRSLRVGEQPVPAWGGGCYIDINSKSLKPIHLNITKEIKR